MYLYKFGKMIDKNKENCFIIKIRIFNCKYLKKIEIRWVNRWIYYVGGLVF